MDWLIESSNSQNYVKIICEGFFTVHDCICMQDDLLSQPFWKPGKNLFIDYTKTTFEGLKLEDLRFIADFHSAKSDRIGDGKIAFLMKTTRDYGIGRQYELLSEAIVLSRIMIFRNKIEAINWLNSDEKILWV